VERVLLGAAFPLELVVPDLSVSLDQLGALVPGSVLSFSRRSDGDGLVLIAGHPAFPAKIVKLGEHRAIRIQSRTSTDGDRCHE
jgi:flagellar motor switch protein FliM